jgi:hypothetical protein
MLGECYAELDRATTDPAAPIHTWNQAMIPAEILGMADRRGNDRLVWLGRFARNDELPGEPHATGRELTVVGFLRRALQLILDFSDSLGETTSDGLVLSPSPIRRKRAGSKWCSAECSPRWRRLPFPFRDRDLRICCGAKGIRTRPEPAEMIADLR